MKSARDFQQIFNRIKLITAATSDADVARALDVTPGALYQFKRQNKFPFERLVEFAFKHNLSLDWLFTGEGKPEINWQLLEEDDPYKIIGKGLRMIGFEDRAIDEAIAYIDEMFRSGEALKGYVREDVKPKYKEIIRKDVISLLEQKKTPKIIYDQIHKMTKAIQDPIERGEFAKELFSLVIVDNGGFDVDQAIETLRTLTEEVSSNKLILKRANEMFSKSELEEMKQKLNEIGKKKGRKPAWLAKLRKILGERD